MYAKKSLWCEATNIRFALPGAIIRVRDSHRRPTWQLNSKILYSKSSTWNSMHNTERAADPTAFIRKALPLAKPNCRRTDRSLKALAGLTGLAHHQLVQLDRLKSARPNAGRVGVS